MPLSCYVPSQIIPKSRVVHLADKQILKRHILSYPKIIVTGGGGGGGGGRGFDTWPVDVDDDDELMLNVFRCHETY